MNWLERRRSRRNPTGQPRCRPPHLEVLTPLLAPLSWLGARLEVVVLTMVAAVLVGGLLVAAQSGVLNDQSTAGVAGVATASLDLTAAASDDDGRLQSLFPQLKVGSAVEFPEDIALYVWDGCTSCDGPSLGLRRFEVTDGVVEEHTLFERGEDRPYIAYGWADADAVYVAECSTGYCGGGGGDRTADAMMTLYRSGDGGATWESLGEAIAPGNVILDGVDPAAWGLPAMPPPMPGRTAHDGVWDVGGIELDLRAIDPRGAAQPDPPAYFLVGRVEVNDRGWLAASWIARVSPEQVIGYLTIFDRDGMPLWTYASSGQFVWLDANRLIGTVVYSIDGRYQSPDIESGWIPSIIDLRDGSMRPILDPFGADPWNRNTVVGVQQR